jgi:RNA polymerase sigma-70 factor, ECF subfamily
MTFGDERFKTTASLPMTTDTPFEVVISRLRAGDEDAATEVFRRFVHRLIALASRQFDDRARSKEDPEDVVLSVLKSFFLRDDRSPFDLSDWEGLWALLAKITVRKCIDRRQFWKAACRDVAREVAPRPETSDDEWMEAIARGPTPDQALVLRETLAQLVGRLHASHRGIAELYFEDYSAAEIADRCSCSERTVGRVVAEIRDALREIEAEVLAG